MHGILLHAFLTEQRRRSSKEIPIDDAGERLHSAQSPALGSDPTERLVLLDALRQLSDLDRAVVVLRYWEDLSVDQTGRELNLSSAAVRNRSLRALARLRAVLTPTPSTMEEAR